MPSNSISGGGLMQVLSSTKSGERWDLCVSPPIQTDYRHVVLCPGLLTKLIDLEFSVDDWSELVIK